MSPLSGGFKYQTIYRHPPKTMASIVAELAWSSQCRRYVSDESNIEGMAERRGIKRRIFFNSFNRRMMREVLSASDAFSQSLTQGC